MDYETAMEMQRICTGEERELARGRIAGEVIDINAETRRLKPGTAEKYRAYYETMKADDTRRVYNIDTLTEETEAIKAQWDEFVKSHKADDIFTRLYDDVGDFFQVPPFEGLDNIEYGVHEVCVLSILEYFTWKTLRGHDHDSFRAQYRDSIAERTYEATADKWIGVYDELQRRYEQTEGNIENEEELRLKLTCCCIVALAAIRDQDSFALDMAQSAAAEKAREIIAARDRGDYKEDESSFTDNVVKLSDFVMDEIKENRQTGK